MPEKILAVGVPVYHRLIAALWWQPFRNQSGNLILSE
jgi:hypothetical protein